MADKTNKNEGNKDQVLLSSSLNYKLNDDSSNNNNDGIKCLVLNNNNNNNYILGQELKTSNFFTPDNVAKAEKAIDSIVSIDANLLLADYGPPPPPPLSQSSVTTKFNENANLTSYSTPKGFGFLNSYQKQSDYSNESLGVGVFETYKPVNSVNDVNDYTNTNNGINQDWQLNLQMSNASTQSNQQQQLVNYSDFVPNQAYNTSTNGALFAAQSYQYQTTNVENNGSNNLLYQNSRSFNYRPTPSYDMYATQSNRINSVIGKSQIHSPQNFTTRKKIPS
jgi:hypothetical protein